MTGFVPPRKIQLERHKIIKDSNVTNKSLDTSKELRLTHFSIYSRSIANIFENGTLAWSVSPNRGSK